MPGLLEYVMSLWCGFESQVRLGGDEPGYIVSLKHPPAVYLTVLNRHLGMQDLCTGISPCLTTVVCIAAADYADMSQ